YASREFITERFGEGYLVDLLGVWDSSDDIDFDTLPDKFVLKCNHDNGVLICKDKNSLDFDKVRKEFTDRLNCDFYKKRREWPYKNIKRKIICEKYMENTNGDELVDYKIYCFNGKAKIIRVGSDKFIGHGREDYYDLDWKHLDLKFENFEQAGDRFGKPLFFNEMISIAENISSGIPFLRVDFNCWDGKLYIGEMTFFSYAGFDVFEDVKWDKLWGSWLELPEKKSGR
ncbi:MAG: ATP-grasp fold amidoligase family protein, partial [Oscillospiraceae bacterium]|nr:ATP-grasp fold amidoligase family protein [Oscillospiraceae bacterium]